MSFNKYAKKVTGSAKAENSKKKSVEELFEFDREEQAKSRCNLIIGTDEAGRGPAAGPVFAAAVCFKNIDPELASKLVRLNDSKQISEKTRLALFPEITARSNYAIEMVDEALIDKINILNATCEAMKRACMKVVREVRTTCMVLVDGNNKIRGYEFPQKTVIKGDSKSASIAAASILAKVARDNYMIELDKEFPKYEWKHNKGYLSERHIQAIQEFGPTKYHRMSFLRNVMPQKGVLQGKLELDRG